MDLVLRGIAPEWWLDTYESERRKVAADMIVMTEIVTEEADLFSSVSQTELRSYLSKGDIRRYTHKLTESGSDFNPSRFLSYRLLLDRRFASMRERRAEASIENTTLNRSLFAMASLCP